MELIKELTEEEKIELAKKERQSERMQDYLLKNYNFYKTNDGIIFEIEKASHLSINKTIWYDDELPENERPSASYENFILENEHHCNRYDCYKQLIKKKTPFYFCKQLSNISYIDYATYNDIFNYGGVKFAKREITKEEIEEILQLYRERKEAYLKRLERYYKRYGNHIHTNGYWRDR